jgi:hypothetical protein
MRFLTPTKKTRLAAWCATPCGKTRFLPRLAASIYQTGLLLRGDRRVLPQGVTHQPRVCAQHRHDLASKTAWCRVSWRRVCCLPKRWGIISLLNMQRLKRLPFLTNLWLSSSNLSGLNSSGSLKLHSFLWILPKLICKWKDHYDIG